MRFSVEAHFVFSDGFEMLNQNSLSGTELEKARLIYLVACSHSVIVVLGTLWLVLAVWRGWGRKIGNFAVLFSRFTYVQAIIVSFGIVGPVLLLGLPAYLLETSYLRRFGGSSSDLSVFSGIEAELLDLLLLTFPIWIWYRLFRNRHHQVWIYLWIVCALSYTAQVLLFTGIFAVGTNDSSFQTEVPQVAQRLHSMVPEFDVGKVEILPGQSDQLIGMTMGIGASAKIYLNKASIQNLSADDLTFGVLHELGHIRSHDFAIKTASFLGLEIVMFAVFNRVCISMGGLLSRFHVFDGDWSALPFLVLVFLWVNAIGGIAMNAVSRHQERGADLYALSVMQQTVPIAPDVAVHFLQSLNAYEPEYPEINPLAEFLFYDHPLISERIEYLRSTRRE